MTLRDAAVLRPFFGVYKPLPMATLYHHPFCPHSRFVRLVLGEFGMDAELIEERAFERRHEFLDEPGRDHARVHRGADRRRCRAPSVIAEYLDETRGLALGDRRMLPLDPGGRVEVRRLVDWFNGKMFDEVTGYLVTEKVFKRYMTAATWAAARPTWRRSVRRAPISAIISPISAG